MDATSFSQSSAAMGAGLALIGPGAWSFDAWLFVEYTFVLGATSSRDEVIVHVPNRSDRVCRR
jgi:hypothetical protein